VRVSFISKPILSPELAVRNVWARTLQLSSKEALQAGEEAKRAKTQMDAILKKVHGDDETRYVNEVYSAIESTFRTLATARNRLEVDFEEVDKLREKIKTDLENTTTFTSDLQSLIPRITAMTFGGTLTGWAFLANVLQWVFPTSADIETIVLPLVLAFGAGIGYVLHWAFVVPVQARKTRYQLVRADYDKIMYYELYLKRSKSALVNLYNTVNQLYKDIFGSDYYTRIDADKVVTDVLTGMSMIGFMCPLIRKHIEELKPSWRKREYIDPDTWVKCETGGEIAEKCDHRKKDQK
jgi:hypothetical protein